MFVDRKEQFRNQFVEDEMLEQKKIGVGKELVDAEEDLNVGIQDEDFKSKQFSASIIYFRSKRLFC